MKLLLVEDEPGLVMTLTDRLAAEGYDVESVTTAPAALERGGAAEHDLILLDVMLPGGNGFDVCRTLRQRGVGAPILMLTARGQVVDRVVGLKLGADDYLVKPFEMAELLARVEALLRRGNGVAQRERVGQREGAAQRQGVAQRFSAAIHEFGDVRVDFRRAEVTKAGRPVALSAREFKLLRYFVEHAGAAVSRDELLNEVWGYNAMPSTRTVDVHVAWLRQKLETNPRHPEHLITVHGLGYKFNA